MPESIGVCGAGALGTLLATQLARAGHRVTVLVRSRARRDALERDHPDLALTDEADALREGSLVFLCVKAYDTDAAARALQELKRGPSPGLCSFQNGWGHMDRLEAALPEVPLLAGATSLGAYLDDSGALHGSTGGTTRVAPWGRTEYRWAEYLAGVLESAGLKCEAGRDAPSILWQKLVLNVAVNPLTALLGLPNGALADAPSLYSVAEAAALEGARVGRARGYVDGGFDPGEALRSLLESTRANRSSMAQDLARGRPTEVDAILGALVAVARESGVAVPVCEGLLTLIHAAERGGRTAP